MEPMKPLKPMSPMQPMAPMAPISSDNWWPADLGAPSTSGSQNGMRYAFFPRSQRVLVERDGRLTTYDSADHTIQGVSQSNHHEGSLIFTSDAGDVELSTLKQLP